MTVGPNGHPDGAGFWSRLVGGLIVVYLPFQWLASALGSDRGQAGLPVAIVVIATTMAVVPVFAWASGVTAVPDSRTSFLLPGLFAQAGIAEELLFRAYLFGHQFSTACEANWTPEHGRSSRIAVA